MPAQTATEPAGLMVGVGSGRTVTAVGALVELQPFESVTVTVKLFVALTVIARVVAPFDQEYDAPLLAVSVTEPPAQNVVGPLGVMVALSGVLTVTAVSGEVDVQPFESVTVT